MSLRVVAVESVFQSQVRLGFSAVLGESGRRHGGRNAAHLRRQVGRKVELRRRVLVFRLGGFCFLTRFFAVCSFARSEERRLGQECVTSCVFGWALLL